MIIEYRTPNDIIHTYDDVHSVEQNGPVTFLLGLTPALMDVETGRYTRFSQTHLIAALKLADGEFLEVVDLPRD
jgi:hypothetical protein